MERQMLNQGERQELGSLIFRDISNVLTGNRFCMTTKDITEKGRRDQTSKVEINSEHFFPRKSLSIIAGDSQYDTQNDLAEEITNQSTDRSHRIEEKQNNFDSIRYLKETVQKINGNNNYSYTERFLFRKIGDLERKLKSQTEKSEKLQKQNQKLKETNSKLQRQRNIEKAKAQWLKQYSTSKENQVKDLIKKQYRFKTKIVRMHNRNAFIKNGQVYVKIQDN